MFLSLLLAVMPGLGPGIHAFPGASKVVDGRAEPGHDVDLMGNGSDHQADSCGSSTAAFASGGC